MRKARVSRLCHKLRTIHRLGLRHCLTNRRNSAEEGWSDPVNVDCYACVVVLGGSVDYRQIHAIHQLIGIE